jgi:hypothetical protein
LREINGRFGDMPQDSAAEAEYQGGMGLAGAKRVELLRALCVLALFFLNFAHVPMSVAAPGAGVLVAAVDTGFCGTPPADGQDHAPCHACRIGGGADLPPPTCVMQPAFASRTVDYIERSVAAVVGTKLQRPSARDPPAA